MVVFIEPLHVYGYRISNESFHLEIPIAEGAVTGFTLSLRYQVSTNTGESGNGNLCGQGRVWASKEVGE